jgi:hypothetical protein
MRPVYWNGKDLPPEFRDLPAGRYLVEAVDSEAPVLGPDEEAGIEAPSLAGFTCAMFCAAEITQKSRSPQTTSRISSPSGKRIIVV